MFRRNSQLPRTLEIIFVIVGLIVLADAFRGLVSGWDVVRVAF
jgi:hypothetical protein